ncbi:MAG TPA: hypothetical protein VH643_37030 [Gemmataceae bacterium]|jgi:hypothetical protein
MMQYWHSLRRLRLIGKTLLSVLLLCCLTDVACSEGKSGSAYDVTVRHLEQIPPGTVLGKEAPNGWSNLIIKSYSRPGAGDMKQLSPTADRLAHMLFTAVLADVKPDKPGGGGKGYKLAKVAVGLGVHVGDEDTVVTPDTQKKLGANLGLLARVVLRTAQEKLADIAVVARSNTLMVFDSPGLLVVEDKHKPIVLRYALLVEERTGRLNTLVWALGREEGGKYSDPIGAIQWLPPNLTDDCILHVDSSEFSLGQPTEKAFAMTTPPKGRKEIKIGDDLKPLASRPRFSTETAAELEGKLREALKRAAK